MSLRKTPVPGSSFSCLLAPPLCMAPPGCGRPACVARALHKPPSAQHRTNGYLVFHDALLARGALRAGGAGERQTGQRSPPPRSASQPPGRAAGKGQTVQVTSQEVSTQVSPSRKPLPGTVKSYFRRQTAARGSSGRARPQEPHPSTRPTRGAFPAARATPPGVLRAGRHRGSAAALG